MNPRRRNPREPRRNSGSQLDRIEARLLHLEHLIEGEVRGSLRAIVSEEAANRRALFAARSEPGYARAWEEDEPLISVTVATVGRPELLLKRSLPSILGQSYRKIEVIVVGDGAGQETKEVVGSIDDRRLRFTDLGPRFPWTSDPEKLSLVGSTRARNAAMSMANGAWVVPFDDDDAMRPNCLQELLKLACDQRAEVVYGRIRIHGPLARRINVGEYPPSLGQFSWAAGMYHAGLRFFERELVAAEFGMPGDWWLAERMLRVGVRFALHPDVLCDVYPSRRRHEEDR